MFDHDLDHDRPRIQTAVLSLDALLAGQAPADCGALAIFSGMVRDHHEGRAVQSLAYTAHVALAERMIRDIEQEVRAHCGVPVCRVVHRIGHLAVGESAILAIASAPHRAEAFAALRMLVDAVKHRVPIWKEEFYTDGSRAFVAGCCIADASEVPAPSRHAHICEH